MPCPDAFAILVGLLFCMLATPTTAQESNGLEERISVLQDSSMFPSAQLIKAQQVAQPVAMLGYRRRSRLQTPPSNIPAGTPLIGEYLVIYEAGVDVAAAIAETQKHVESVVAAYTASSKIQAASVGTPPTVTLITTPQMLSRGTNLLIKSSTASSVGSISATAINSTSKASADQIATAASVPAATGSGVDASSPPQPAAAADVATTSQALVIVPEGIQPEEIQSAISCSAYVRSVVQNRVVALMPKVASTPCGAPQAAAGITNPAWNSTRFAWKGCLSAATKLTFIGERCGSSLEKFRWNAIYTANKGTLQLSNSSCVWLRADVTNSTVVTDFFGDCGAAPTQFPELPSSVCAETTASSCTEIANLDSFTINITRKSCSLSTASRIGAVYQGTTCGPSSAYIQWNQLAPVGCSARSRSSMKSLLLQASWLGQCGVPPFQAKYLPTWVCSSTTPASSPSPGSTDSEDLQGPIDSSQLPPETGYSIPVPKQLLSGDTATWGMQRVGAYDCSANTVVDASAAINATEMIVVTIDTGVDVTHPDLRATIKDLVDVNSSSWYNRDGNGHGTHVAGIIGAKNNGGGVTGVVPGMPVYSIKVLGRDGSGLLSTVYAAFVHVLSLLQQGVKVVAVNMSLTMSDGVTAPDATSVQVTCGYIRQITAFGTAVVVAAGNDYAKDISNILPALCPEAIAVTAINSVDRPAAFSNIAAASAASSVLDRIIAAPGVGINSTYPLTMGSYTSQDGTSMAAPFVAAGFAKCFLSGKCKLSTSPNVTPALTVNYPQVQAAARLTPCGTNGRCAPEWGTTSYYGYMLDVKNL